MSKKLYNLDALELLELTEHLRLEDALEDEYKALANHLKSYREPEKLGFTMHDGLNLICGLCFEADFADAIGGYSIPFYQKWGEDTVRGRILYDICVTWRAVDGGDLVLITQFYSELLELVREQDLIFTSELKPKTSM